MSISALDRFSGPPRARSADRWLRAPRPRPQALVDLVCFPHAGGSASFFHRWHRLVPGHVATHVVQYPGRADRLDEPLIGTMDELADAVTLALGTLPPRPRVLYGHSMGAAVAFEVARRLHRAGRSPRALIVSGRPAPWRQRPGTVHRRGEEALVEELRRLGGTGDDVLATPELRAMVLQVLGNDYRLIETYVPRPGPALTVPVTVLRGTEDPELTEHEARGWAEVTDGPTRVVDVPGDHFHVAEHAAETVAAVRASVDAVVPPPAPPSTP